MFRARGVTIGEVSIINERGAKKDRSITAKASVAINRYYPWKTHGITTHAFDSYWRVNINTFRTARI